jgi:hypothetical protein
MQLMIVIRLSLRPRRPAPLQDALRARRGRSLAAFWPSFIFTANVERVFA